MPPARHAAVAAPETQRRLCGLQRCGPQRRRGQRQYSRQKMVRQVVQLRGRPSRRDGCLQGHADLAFLLLHACGQARQNLSFGPSLVRSPLDGNCTAQVVCFADHRCFVVVLPHMRRLHWFGARAPRPPPARGGRGGGGGGRGPGGSIVGSAASHEAQPGPAPPTNCRCAGWCFLRGRCWFERAVGWNFCFPSSCVRLHNQTGVRPGHARRESLKEDSAEYARATLRKFEMPQSDC